MKLAYNKIMKLSYNKIDMKFVMKLLWMVGLW